MPLLECRQDFQGAIDDLNKALELEEARFGGEDPGNLKTSLGLVHRNWADCELRHADGELARWRTQARLAEDTLRDAYELTRSTYPAHALARGCSIDCGGTLVSPVIPSPRLKLPGSPRCRRPMWLSCLAR